MQLVERVRPAKVWIAASTMPPADAGDVDEDDAVIAAFRELARDRPAADPGAAQARAVRCRGARNWTPPGSPSCGGRAMLRDAANARASCCWIPSASLAACSPWPMCVFMGGTLAARGGHNILEPALLRQAGDRGAAHGELPGDRGRFRAAGAWWRSPAAEDWRRAVERRAGRTPAGSASGRADVRRGAARRNRAGGGSECAQLYRVPRYRPAMPWFRAGLGRWRACGASGGAAPAGLATMRARRKLDVPVISVGNLTMGGTGKTPCVLRLTELLRERGTASRGS